MSTEAVASFSLPDGAPELTALGKRLEILRIERGVSKQRLARRAGTSRQQLWRVMTGKSELTSSLRERLAGALSVEPSVIAPVNTSTHGTSSATLTLSAPPTVAPATAVTANDYMSEAAHLAATLRTLPSGDGGRRLKRALLNALDDLAVDSSRALPAEFAELRRRVLAGEA